MAIQINGTTGISGVDGSATTPALQGQDTNTGISFGTDEVNIVTNGETQAKVDSSGRVLVGTSTSIQTNDGFRPSLQVISDGSALSAISNGRYSADAFGSSFVFLKNRNTAVGSHTVLQNNDELGKIQWDGSDGSAFKQAVQIQAFVDGTPGTNDMPGRLVFSTTADGAASPTERLRITSDGTLQLRNSPGIDFSQIQTNATGMTSETLDSYEEGTWTPTTSGANNTLSSVFARYVKIGKLVWFTVNANLSTTGTPNTGHIGGLPFSASSSQGAYPIRNADNILSSFNGAAYIDSTTIYVQNSSGTGSAGAKASLSNVNFGISGCYEAS